MMSAFQEVWSSLLTFLTGLFSNISKLFYEPASSGSGGQLTFIGTLALITAGVSLILLVFNLIRSFVVARG